MRKASRLALALAGLAGVAAAQAPPQAAATLSHTSVPAAGRQEAIVNVSAFGYYALTVSSSQGTALLFVDRMAGPGPQGGTTGAEDGRLDLFLDRGEYKLVTLGHEKASGTAKLDVHPFTELHAPQPPLVVELKPVAEGLQDFQQASYWLQIDEPRVVAIEAAGRNLANLRLWRDGTWLHEAIPEREVIEPKKGHPMLACRLTARLESGLYLLTAYGGPGQAWSENAGEHPLLLRYGIPRLPQAGRQRLAVGPFGYDRFLTPGETTYFRLELPEARPAQLQVGRADPNRPFNNPGSATSIDKKSLPPVAEVELSKTPGTDRIVTVRAEAGQPYILQQFEASNEYKFGRTGEFWVSTLHSGHPEDSVDATVIVARWTDLGQDRAAFLDQTVEIDSNRGWARRCNLLDTLTVFLKVGSTGRYEVIARGVEATFRIEPFFTSRPSSFELPRTKRSGGIWDLDAGFYVLTVEPLQKGILDIIVRPFGLLTYALELLGKETDTEQTPLHAGALFPRVSLDAAHWYVVYINQQPGVRAGVVVRPLPLDLTEPLPVAQRPNEELKTSFRAIERATLRARDEAGGLLELSVDGGQRQKEIVVEQGEHTVTVENPGQKTVLYSLALDPVRLQAGTPLPPIPPATLETLPKFPVLTASAPLFLDLDSGATATFLVRAETPALYRLETTGLLATEGNVRTRTVLSLDRQAGNGVGRNFLIQQYLREGDYQLTVRPQGLSAGHLGVRVEQTAVTDGGLLATGVPARISLPPGQGVAYRFTIPSRGEYHLRALGLGRDFRCRLEDADGWPIEQPNIRADITRTFEPGTYRLVLLPEGVTTRRVTVLDKVPELLRFSGHGPHALPLDQQAENLWEEPAQDGARLPDVWEFSLPAWARAQITLSGEMQGELELVGSEGAGKVASIPPGQGWFGELTAARYRLSVVCSRQNNQVGYRVAVRPVQLVAGLSREITAPDYVKISVGRPGLVELSSFGSDDVRGILLGSKGQILARNDDRPDDWNFHIATHLEAGTYALRVLPVGSGPASCTVSMRTPEEAIEPPLVVPGRREIDTGRAAHVVPLQLPEGTQFLAASLRSAESVGCAVEAEEGKGWRPLATQLGRDLRLELPLSAPGGPGSAMNLRVRVWSVDQRGLSARLVVAAVNPPIVGEAALRSGVDLAPVAGTEPAVGAVTVNLDRPGVFLLSGAEARASSAVARVATAAADEPIAAAGSSLWLVGDLSVDGRAAVRATRVVAEMGQSLALRVPVGDPVVCDLSGEGPRTVLALASSMAGQPGVRIIGRSGGPSSGESRPMAMAVGRHGAVTVAVGVRQAAAAVWQAEPSVEPLEIRLRQFAYSGHLPEVAPWGLVSGELSEQDSRIYQLPAGPKRLHLALGEGVVAVLANDGGVESVHWAGGQAFAEHLESAASRLTVLRAGTEKGVFAINILPPSPADAPLVLGAERPFESEETTAGILRIAVPPFDTPADRPYTVHVRGSNEAVLLTADGQVRRGRDVTVDGTGGTLLVPHGPGRVLCWRDRTGGLGEALWGLLQNLVASSVTPPTTLPLRGKAMLVHIKIGHPAMLHLRSATSLATRLVRPEGEPEIELQPSGCMLDAYLPSGAADLGLRAVSALELVGTADLTTTPIVRIDEGLGPEVLLPPGETRAFSFTVAREGPVGVGVRADSDVVTCTLLDSAGRRLGTGVVQMARLSPGTYVLALHAPPSARPVSARPAVVGIRPPDTGPPAEVIRKYLQMATGRQEDGVQAPAAQGGAPGRQEEPAYEEPPEEESPDEGEPTEEPTGGIR